MPLVMRTAIAVDINLATFQKIDLFKVAPQRLGHTPAVPVQLRLTHVRFPQGCDQQMLVDMLLRLKSIVYLPGDFVVQKVSHIINSHHPEQMFYTGFGRCPTPCRGTSVKRCTSSRAERCRWWEDPTTASCSSL